MPPSPFVRKDCSLVLADLIKSTSAQDLPPSSVDERSAAVLLQMQLTVYDMTSNSNAIIRQFDLTPTPSDAACAAPGAAPKVTASRHSLWYTEAQESHQHGLL
jgi:hypothetical protein